MRAMSLVFVVVYALAAAVPSEAGPPPASGPTVAPATAALRHVRPRDAVATLLLRFGREKSARFRELVRDLEESKVIVYVDVRQDSGHRPSGGLTFIAEAGGIRWVRAMVDSGTPSYARTCQDVVRLTAILGHELQHALEVADDVEVRDEATMTALYERIGQRGGLHVYDTLAAQEVGRTIRRELLA